MIDMLYIILTSKHQLIEFKILFTNETTLINSLEYPNVQILKLKEKNLLLREKMLEIQEENIQNR